MKPILLIALTFAVGCIQLVRVQRAASAREQIAQFWNEDSPAQFVAVGITGSTLVIVLPDADIVSCDAYMDILTADKRDELKQVGFERVTCGNLERKL